MSEAFTILTALDALYKADTSLAASVASWNIFEDEIELANVKRIFPFVNLNIDVKKTGQAQNLPTQTYERRSYMILITCAVKADSKSAAKQALFTLIEDLELAYKDDRTISGNVKNTNERSEIATDALKYKDRTTWIGRGLIEFEVHIDQFIG